MAMNLWVTQVDAAQVSKDNIPSNKPILESVIADAKASAKKQYNENDHGLDEKLKKMDYQQYRAIRFEADKSLWRGKNDYEIQFFHPGFLYQQPVTVVTVDRSNKEKTVPFDSSMFRYDKNAEQFAGLTDKKSGFAGFRVHYPLKSGEYKDEFAVFLGASYFRLVGKNQVYGLSARGLAIDTALPKGEEFPHFTKFWLIEPAKGGPITLYARLESPSVAGAYEFIIDPGVNTEMKVRSWLFARQDIEKLGIAPFTSMFLYGENTERSHDDYRPEVHDSDGMMMINQEGEQVWRVLTNPARLQITSLGATAPKGFGMMQRDNNFENYLDAEANYHLRPSFWVTPQDGFEKGRLELVEIPTDSEIHDNIAAYWVPEEAMTAGQGRYFRYTLKTVEQSPHKKLSIATVLRTRQGASQLPGFESTNEKSVRRFIVDFALPKGAESNPDNLNLILEASNGAVDQARLQPVNGGKELRATFLLTPASSNPVDMRLFINTKQDEKISEVWNYVYQPE
ncbi:glucan biosynthesis protein [Alteromonas pelagimontana]|uniref:Glucan biosynthesis protein n=2 Tax=Alteromonas pelagimontana TaxID=1858656 RepID=A0A6M4MIE9_9ALTE|nr:glucan biosynthesis protein [Alteromonas pelagimontana]